MGRPWFHACPTTMAKAIRQGSATNSIVAAANYVRRGSRAMLESGTDRHNTRSAQRYYLIEWFKRQGQLLNKGYCGQFSPVSSGAEHCVYFDLANLRAIKATHPNRFGHSVAYEGAQATPLEYLRRLAFHNRFFGDDIRLLGCIECDEDLEIITSQPWITADMASPAATAEQIDAYFKAITFRRSAQFEGALFYSAYFGLVVGDAHSGNVLVSETGKIVPIDLVVGRPGAALKLRLEQELGLIQPQESGSFSFGYTPDSMEDDPDSATSVTAV
jgi:hypothetical protein